MHWNHQKGKQVHALSLLLSEVEPFPTTLTFPEGGGTQFHLWSGSKLASSRGPRCPQLKHFQPLPNTNLVTYLQVEVAGLGVEAKVDPVTIVSDNVLGSRILAVPSANQFL